MKCFLADSHTDCSRRAGRMITVNTPRHPATLLQLAFPTLPPRRGHLEALGEPCPRWVSLTGVPGLRGSAKVHTGPLPGYKPEQALTARPFGAPFPLGWARLWPWTGVTMHVN